MNIVLKSNCRLVNARPPLKLSCHLRKWSRIALRTTRFFSNRRSSARNSDNYYEILGVKRDCTSKEIKKAFFKLSKELHPDRNPSDPSLNARFVKLYEAYSVLGRVSSRLDYDRSLNSHLNHGPFGYNVSYHRPSGKRQEKEEWTQWSSMNSSSGTRPEDCFWENRDKSQDKYYEGRSYYGIKGLNRLPNWCIAVGCFVIFVFGIGSHYAAIKFGNRISLGAQDKKDRTNLDFYLTARMRAIEQGHEGQLLWFKSMMDGKKDPQSTDEKSESSEEESG